MADSLENQIPVSDSASSDRINVVFSSDKNFVPFFATTLLSLLENYSDPRDLHVYLLTDAEFSGADADKILSMRSVRDFSFHPVVVDASLFDNVRTSDGISVATYNRLFMHDLLPAEVKRVFYFDCDILIEKNIGAVYDLPMDDYLFRGVEDSISTQYKAKFGLPQASQHINAGVMLCNIDLMRKIGFSKTIEDYLAVNQYRIVLGDQQLINEAFTRLIGPLPVEWNVHGNMFRRGWVRKVAGKMNSMDKAEARAAIRSPAVIHYTLKRKPWTSDVHPRSDRWWEYNARSPLPLPALSSRKDKPGRFAGLWPPSRIPSFCRKRAAALIKTLEFPYLFARDLIAILINRGIVRPLHFFGTVDRTRETLLSSVLRELAGRKGSQGFVAEEFVESLPVGTPVLCNARPVDLDGGFNENLKTILRTGRISRDNVTGGEVALILVHRPNLPEYWDCVNAAYYYDVPLVFVESNLFAAYSSYFDKSSTFSERKCLGFIFDDMGYYFDARQPSRIEATLNDPGFALNGPELDRAKKLIAAIREFRITKYNKYVTPDVRSAGLEQDAVVVIDQKRDDASIAYARSDEASFDRMLRAALDENPGKTIYFKAHPDNIHRGQALDAVYLNARVKVLGDEVSAPDLLDAAGKVYVVSSQMGFEALLRGKTVITFGMPFYAGWGLTEDRCSIPRRTLRRSVEEIFHVVCIRQSVYMNPNTGERIPMEELFQVLLKMRARSRDG
ncbi:MAG: hypothetical protein Tsb0019_03020 [Roseibium sp.]